MLKLKMMLCVMMLPLVVVGCTSKQSAVSQCAGYHLPGVDNAASPWLADTAETGLFHPQREVDHYAKTTGRNPEVYTSSADRVAHIDGQLMRFIVSTHTRFQRSINASVNKTEQSIYECLLGFCFNNIFCAATNFGCIDSFLRLIPETKKWWVMVSCAYCCRFVLNSKRLLSTSCNKQGQRSRVAFFSWCYSRCFLKFAESYV